MKYCYKSLGKTGPETVAQQLQARALAKQQEAAAKAAAMSPQSIPSPG